MNFKFNITLQNEFITSSYIQYFDYSFTEGKKTSNSPSL